MFGPRSSHGDGQYRAGIAIANAHCRQSKYCTGAVLAVVLTKDNAVFGPRFYHGDGQYRRKIAVRVAVEHICRAIALVSPSQRERYCAISRASLRRGNYVAIFARALSINNLLMQIKFIDYFMGWTDYRPH